ncbi:THAP domain-containing protein 1 [Plakobranchus ocellatus]|uniref:THAP domain-containing protein 1 n=1 Tax=Plakobranchus ocellatus TaxID=259542 RepID=A0AAV4A4M4_9GAST|nr:THAP domain-containing protein 1 [Plakobranchus ocellatus]
MDILHPYVLNPETWHITVFSPWLKICSDHFRVKDYVGVDYKRVLRIDALPSIFTRCTPVKDLGLKKTSPSKKSPRTSCAALGCENSLHSGNLSKPWAGSRLLYSFPLGRPALLKKWEVAVGRKAFAAQKSHRLCSRHFTSDSFIGNPYYRKLRKDAVPTQFTFPPLDLSNQVDPFAPYLQPQVVLNRVDEPEPQLLRDPRIVSGNIPYQALAIDHNYQKAEVNVAGEISRFKFIINTLRDDIISTSQRMKVLKISVCSLKHQYQLEQELISSDGQDR